MLVVDASVLVKLAAAEPDSELAVAAVASRTDCIAPDLILIELASALTKKTRFEDMTTDWVMENIEAVMPLLAEIVSIEPLLGGAVDLSRQLDHSLFDCIYLALALDRDCAVLTADAKFAKRAVAAGYAPNVVTLR
ncbi:type II toxin-antitoxin system VapC family toxin [Sphingomonas sp. RS2018]